MIATITGGRDHTPSRWELLDLLDLLVTRKVTVVRTGGARGVDTIVYNWLRVLARDPKWDYACSSAEYRIDHLERWVPDWLRHHHAAGPMRNVAMLMGNTGIGSGIRLDQSTIHTAGQRASLCVAFTGGVGTMRCCQAASDLAIEIVGITRRGSA